MKKLFTLLTLLVLCVTGAWAGEESFVYNCGTTANSTYVGTSFSISGTYILGNGSTTSGNMLGKGQKVQCVANSDGDKVIVIDVKKNYTITNIVMHANINSNGKTGTLSDIKVDGTTATGFTSTSIPARNSNPSASCDVTISDDANENITLYFTNMGSNQMNMELIVTYDKAEATTVPEAPVFSVNNSIPRKEGSTITITSSGAETIYYKWTNSAETPDTWDTYTTSATIPLASAGTPYLHAYGSNTIGASNITTTQYTIRAAETLTAISSAKTWNLGDYYVESFKGEDVIGNLGFNLGDIYENTKSDLDGLSFTKTYRSGGSGDTSKRHLHIKINGNYTLKIYAENGSGNSNNLSVKFGSATAVQKSLTTFGKYEFSYTGGANNVDVYIYGSSSALIYAVVAEPLASLTVTPSSAEEFTYVDGATSSDAQSFELTLSNSTKAISASLTGDYEMSKTGLANSYTSSAITDLTNGNTLYVRLKGGLEKGDHNGTLTLSNDDIASDVVLNLTGSVTAQTYAVTYDLNGASGDAPTQAATEEGGKFNLATAPTRTCYTFNGWKCNVDNVTYAANYEYTMTAAPTTFTAQWTANYSTSLDFASVVLAKINDGTNPPAIADFLADGNMVGENVDQGTSGWETGGDWHGIIKEGYLGYKVKYSGAKVSFLAPAGKLVTIVLGSIAANVTLSKNGTTSTISSKSGDDAETIVTPFVTGEDMLVSLTTTSGGTVTLKKIIISDYATATISANKYATFSSTQKLDFTNTGVTAYKATTNTNSSVHLEEVTVVPANTGVLLYADVAENTVFTIPVSTEDASNMEGNKLQSTANGAHDVTAEEYGKAYVFGKLNDEVGFYKAAEGKTVAQGRCYLLLDAAIPQEAPFLSIIFDDGATTNINLNNNDNLNFDQNAPRYNLAGQKVSDSYKGIVIVNGKKVVRK